MRMTALGLLGLAAWLVSSTVSKPANESDVEKKTQNQQTTIKTPKDQQQELVPIDVLSHSEGKVENGGCVISCIDPAEKIDGFSSVQSQQSRGRLGIQVRQPSRTLRKHLQLPAGMGLVVQSVQHASSADVAGLKVDDVLFLVDGQKLFNRHQLLSLVESYPANKKISLKCYSSGREKTISVQLPKSKLSSIEAPVKNHVPVLRTLKHPKIVGSVSCSKCHITAGQPASPTTKD